MRALLVVNPAATTTTPRTRDVLIRALGADVDLDVEVTREQGHAAALAASAAKQGYDLVATLGGDGTINEVVNGLLAGGLDGELPTLAVIPGGSANVFARSLGLPADPVEATGAVLEALRAGTRRTVGLGHAVWGDISRHFIFCAGLGFDAEVVRAVEGRRNDGRRATPALYVNQAVRRFFRTDRRHPVLTLTRPGREPVDGIFMVIVSNTSPWTYMGRRPLRVTPSAGFDTGLDVLGFRRIGMFALLNAFRQSLGENGGPPKGRHLVQAHDESEFRLTAERPVAFQLDGDYLCECADVTFRAIPSALQVMV